MAKELNLKIIPKPKPKVSFKSNFLVGLSFFAFIICLVSVLGLNLFLNPSWLKKKEKAQKDFILLDSPTNMELRERLVLVNSKMSDFDLLWKKHRSTIILFDFLKSICHKKVQIRSVNLGLEEGVAISFEAVTENFRTLGEQLISLKQDNRISLFNVSGISLSDGGITFNISMELFPEVFPNYLNN